MKNSQLTFITFVALTLSGYFQESSARVLLPQTGQTRCYDAVGAQIPCEGTGQDGDIQAGLAWPNPRFTDNGNSTATDNLTGLTWTKDANLMVNRDPSFDSDSTISDGEVRWQRALDYVKKLNKENYLGYDDWRLPNANELMSLVDASQSFPALSQGHPFVNVQHGIYWSSTTNPTDHREIAKTAYLGGFGIYFGFPKQSYFRVWPVRGNSSSVLKTGQTDCFDIDGVEISCNGTGQDGEIQAGVTWIDARFLDNNNGTVTDDLTGLVWAKDANVIAGRDASFDTDGTLADGLVSWRNALEYVKKLNKDVYLGFCDWRLPNTVELASLLDFTNSSPNLPSAHPFTSIQQTYWSSTTSPWSSSTNTYSYGDAWVTGMYGGGARASAAKSGNQGVWPIRGMRVAFGVNKGDADGDSGVTIKDALFALRVSVGLTVATQDQIARADVAPLDCNQQPVGDGNVDMADALTILRRVIGVTSW